MKQAAARANASSPYGRRLRLYKISVLVVSVILSVAAAEVALRIIEKRRFADRAIEQNLIPDPELGNRLALGIPGHDANGFRNNSVPTHADIVAIGDSQTWGVNADQQEAWPPQLARLSGRTVYNMSLGGYGTIQYWVLERRAEKLSPRIIVVGVYLGNDLYDTYRLVYTNDNYKDLRLPNAPAELANDTIGPQAETYWYQEKEFHNRFGRNSLNGLSYWLREHSAIGRLLNRDGLWPGATDVDYEIDKAWAQAYPLNGSTYEGGNVRTVFTIAYRFCALNLEDQRILEGLRISKILLGRMRDVADSEHAHLLIAVLPTKESVYTTALTNHMHVGSNFAALVSMEQRARSELLSACREQQVACIDMLPALSNAIARDEQAYPSTTESHPNAKGYAVIAKAVDQAITSYGW